LIFQQHESIFSLFNELSEGEPQAQQLVKRRKDDWYELLEEIKITVFLIHN